MVKFVFSIKWLFIIVTLILLSGISVSNYFIFYYVYSRHFMRDMDVLADNFKLETDKLFTSVEALLYNLQGLICSDLINFNDLERVNYFLMNFMRTYPHVTSINYGDGRGNGYLILNDRGKWRNRIKKENDKGYVTWHILNEEGKILEKSRSPDDYDPRNTIWYKQALSSKGIQWSKEYIFRTTKDPGITASFMICENTKEVIGVDVMIKDFNIFLEKIKKNYDFVSKLYLLSDESNVIGFVDGEVPEKGKIYEINERDFPLLHEALNISRKDGGVSKITFKGQKYLIGIRHWPLGTRKLSLVMLVPTTALTATINLVIFYQIFISLGLAFLILFYITKKYTNPLIEISREVKNLTTGKQLSLEQYIDRTDEIGQLSREIREASYQLSKMREMEERIKKSEHFEAIQRSLGEAVHKFKDLINVIHGFASLAQSKITNEFARNAVDQIIKASNRAIYLVREILTITGERKYEMKDVDLNAIVLSMKSRIESIMGEKIKVKFTLSEEPLITRADKEAIDEVVLNILDNAKDAMKGEGILTITTQKSVLSGEDFAILSISDTGIGMDEETKKRIFEPFYTTKGAQGTGLGLPIVYRIVKDHGGFIEVESELGKGTTFRIYLPLRFKAI